MLIMLFSLSLLPLPAYHIMQVVHHDKAILSKLYVVAITSATLNYILNPILYYFANENIR